MSRKTFLLYSVSIIFICSCFLCGGLEVQGAEDGDKSAAQSEKQDTNITSTNDLKSDDPTPIDILFVGDSITDLWDNTPENRKVWDKYFGQYKTLNIAVGGHTTAACLKRLDCKEAAHIAPKMIIVMIGTNDVGYMAMAPEVAIEGNRKILAKLRTRWPNARILHLAVFPSDPKNPNPDSPRRQRILKVNEALPAMADGEHIVFLNLHDLFMDEKGVMHRKTHPDLVHPNAAGYEIWGQALKPVIDKWMQELK